MFGCVVKFKGGSVMLNKGRLMFKGTPMIGVELNVVRLNPGNVAFVKFEGYDVTGVLLTGAELLAAGADWLGMVVCRLPMFQRRE